MIYTDTKSKMTRKDREKREHILEEQRAIKNSLKRTVCRKNSILTPKVYRRETEYIPSLGDGIGNAAALDVKRYTGDAIVGIGVLHKSNSIPIFKQEDAVDLANMRR